MNRIKLKIYGTNAKDMVYYIYRSKNKELPDEFEKYINDIVPVGTVSEIRDKFDVVKEENVLLNRVENVKEHEGFTAFVCPYEFIYNNKSFIINLKNSIEKNEHNNYFEIFIGDYVITKIKKYTYNINTEQYDVEIISNKDDISNIIKIKDRRTVYINKGLVNFKDVTFDFEVNIHYFVDDGLCPNIECESSFAHGVFDVDLKLIDAKDDLIFYQDCENVHNYYYYKIIGKNVEGYVTELSLQRAIENKENPSTVEFILESTSDDVITDDTKWEVVSKNNKATDKIMINKKKKLITDNRVQTFKQGDLKVDDKFLYEDKIRFVNITNIWSKYNKSFNYRNKKKFRAKNLIGSVETEYTKPLILNGHVEVMIDKLMILKKDVTSLSEGARKVPIEIGDENSEILKIYVRQNGMYYKDYFINDFDTNTQISDPNIITAVTKHTDMLVFSIKDQCNYSKVYNYTVYLYDELGQISTPSTYVF